VAQLEKSGVRENTLLIFTGDNGTDKPIVTSWNGTKVAGGKGSMTDAGTRVPLIASWPAGIKQPERVVDDLVEFCDLMPTLCEVTGADLPPNYAGDGSSIVPVLQNNASARKKDWIYIWYRGQVMVRNNQYSLLAKTDGSDASLTRYKGPFDGEKLKDYTLSQPESAIKQQFEATLARLAKSRLLSVSNEIRVKMQKPRRNKK
jgi:arylsulfatase A